MTGPSGNSSSIGDPSLLRNTNGFLKALGNKFYFLLLLTFTLGCFIEERHAVLVDMHDS